MDLAKLSVRLSKLSSHIADAYQLLGCLESSTLRLIAELPHDPSGLTDVRLALPLVVVMRYVVVAREEVHLERHFGAAYRDYKARVRRWL